MATSAHAHKHTHTNLNTHVHTIYTGKQRDNQGFVTSLWFWQHMALASPLAG